jgi:hypothetical protein
VVTGEAKRAPEELEGPHRPRPGSVGGGVAGQVCSRKTLFLGRCERKFRQARLQNKSARRGEGDGSKIISEAARA